MPTLAELRAQTGPKPLPKATATVTLVEGQHLLARSQEIEERLTDLLMEIARDEEKAKGDGRERTRKSGQKPAADDPRISKLREEMREVVDALSDFQETIDLEGLEGGAWQRYKDEHPPREDNKADQKLTGDLCNSTDVFNDLGQFVKTWKGDVVAPGEWDAWLAERICYADRRDLVTEVVEMHEARLPRRPKSSSSSSPTETSATD